LLANEENVKGLLKTSKFPPANRNLISEYYNDPDISVFAKQALNSKSFYNPDVQAAKQAF